MGNGSKDSGSWGVEQTTLWITLSGDFLEVAGGSWNMSDIFLHFLFFQGKMGGAAYSPNILW